MDIVAGITAINGGLKIVKYLQQIDKGLSDAEYKMKVAELYSALADAKMSLTDVKIEMAEKDKKITTLTDRLKSKTELVEHEGYMFKKGPEGKPKGSPFCPICLETDGTQIRPERSVYDSWQCPKCNASYSELQDFGY